MGDAITLTLSASQAAAASSLEPCYFQISIAIELPRRQGLIASRMHSECPDCSYTSPLEPQTNLKVKIEEVVLLSYTSTSSQVVHSQSLTIRYRFT